MISFFKGSSPYLAGVLLAFLVLIRVPIIVHGLPLLTPELNWMLVGERLARGFMLYSETWDNISPLSAVVYWAIHLQFGRSQLAYQIIALVISGFQVIYFNHIMLKNQVYYERTYLPGLLYVLFISAFVDFYTLSPVLLATTSLLFALNKLFSQLDQRTISQNSFEAGFYIGVATLFYLPSATFYPFALFALILFSASHIREFFLVTLGFAFPLALAFLAAYLLGNHEAMLRQNVFSLFAIDHLFYVNLKVILALLLVPTTFMLLGMNKLISNLRYINYQRRCQQAMVLWLIFGTAALLLSPTLSPMQFVILIPGLAFFGAPYFLSNDRKWILETAFGVGAALVLFVHYASIYPWLPGHNAFSVPELEVKPTDMRAEVERKRVLVLGNDIREYQYGQPATPFLNWELSKQEIRNVNDYGSVINVYQHFKDDLPDLIIDRQQAIPPLFKRVPGLATLYQPTGKPGVYRRVSKLRLSLAPAPNKPGGLVSLQQ